MGAHSEAFSGGAYSRWACWTQADSDLSCAGSGSVDLRFEAYLERHNIPWPRLESGRLDLDDFEAGKTFREMAKLYPSISPLRELRHALSTMRLFSDLTIGEDKQESRPSQRVRFDNRSQPAEQRQVHFRHQHVDPRVHQAAAGAWHRLHRLDQPGGRYRRGAVGRQEYDGRFQCR